MEGLLSLLVFAGLFYLMMRFGCGAHMIHGHGGGQHQSTDNHKDPVCGMDVDPSEGYGKVHKGALYRFCSRSCLDKFENDPDQYLKNNSLDKSMT